jgi:hypothetical protein
MLCGPGTYSSGGATSCSQCPSGKYGSTAGLNTSACSGPCPAGSFCPVGTASPTELCPQGTYSINGASSCSACPLATPYSPPGSTSSASCSSCASRNGPSSCGGGLHGKMLSVSPPACTGSLASWTLWIDMKVSVSALTMEPWYYPGSGANSNSLHQFASTAVNVLLMLPIVSDDDDDDEAS